MIEDAGYWNDVAREWSGDEHDRLWRRHSDAVNQQLLARWLPEGSLSRVLKTDLFDEAVSEGLFSFLQERAETPVGIDVSIGTVRNAQAHRFFPLASCTDVRHLSFADGSFDVVVSNSTLDHFQSFEAVVVSLRELHRVLRPGGHLILTMDNLANPVIAMRNALPFRLWNRLGVVPYYVGKTCGIRRLRRTVEAAGFRVLDSAAIMHSPRIFMVWLARVIQRRAGPATQRRFLRWLMWQEGLGRWPTRFLTGNFVAAHCTK